VYVNQFETSMYRFAQCWGLEEIQMVGLKKIHFQWSRSMAIREFHVYGDDYYRRIAYLKKTNNSAYVKWRLSRSKCVSHKPRSVNVFYGLKVLEIFI